MCGICGVVNIKSEAALKGTLEKMCQKMVHRGPDDEGIYIRGQGSGGRDQEASRSPSVGLGHRRLSIIDLSTAGHQPMCNEDKTIWLVLNGEIYNFKNLRNELKKKGHRFKSNTD